MLRFEHSRPVQRHTRRDRRGALVLCRWGLARCKRTYLTLNRCFVGVVEYNSRQPCEAGSGGLRIGERDSKKVVLWSVGVVEAAGAGRFCCGLGGSRWVPVAFHGHMHVCQNNRSADKQHCASHTTCGSRCCVFDAPIIYNRLTSYFQVDEISAMRSMMQTMQAAQVKS